MRKLALDQQDEERMDDNGGPDHSTEKVDGDLSAIPQAKSTGRPSPFLDTFYGLSSPNSDERAESVRQMLRCCLIGSERNTKDASYAMKRLMNGLCSGRAAARQGCASALASFLKISFQNKLLQEIQATEGTDEERNLSILAFVRHRLIQHTTIGPSQGRRKGSEDRDFQFGLLFGVLSIVRSGIIFPAPMQDHDERKLQLDEILSVTTSLTSDLAALFHSKVWLQEPAGHAIGTLLNSLYALCPTSKAARLLVSDLVEKVVVPEVLFRGVVDEASRFTVRDNVSAEHLALALNIQAESQEKSIPLLGPLGHPILTEEALPYLTTLLADTCHVVQPRTHMVWDALFHFLTEPVASAEVGVMVRRLRRKSLYIESSSIDLLCTIMERVLVNQLLRANGDEITDGKAKSASMTHDSGALALCLVRKLSGVEFYSSISGRTRILLDPDIIEKYVFSPRIVRPLFTRVVSVHGAKAPTSSPLLKPLSLQVLENIADSLEMKVGDESDDESERRLAFIRPLLRCQPRFDAESKTKIIARLSQANAALGYEKNPAFGEKLIGFLVEQIASTSEESTTANLALPAVTHHNAQGYVEVLFQYVKSILGSQDMEVDHEVVQKILGVFMSSAFFDSRALTSIMSSPVDETHVSTISESALNSAISFKGIRSDLMPVLPHDVRSAASSRFFSALALIVAKACHNKGHDKASEIFMGVTSSWERLEKSGASLISSAWRESSFEAEQDPRKSLARLHRQVQKIGKHKSSPEELQKLVSSLHLLGMTLFIALLDVGEGAESDHSIQLETKRSILIAEFLSDAKNLCQLFLKPDDEDCPLTRLSELCVSILSSSLSEPSPSVGAYPSLLREVVKLVWLRGLNVADWDPTVYCKDVTSVLHCLLDSIGCLPEYSGEEESDENDSDLDSGEDTNSESSASEMKDLNSQDLDEGVDAIDEDDEQLDPERLQSLLEEEGDMELEHHEGADGALATFIQAKKAAQKAGRLAEERSVLAKQLRCTVLLETLLVSKSKGRAMLLTPESVLRLLVSVVQYRRKLEAAASEKDSGMAPAKERQVLLDRLTSILQTRLLRWRFAASQWDEESDTLAICSGLCNELFQELKRRTSKVQHQCCSLSVIAVLRAVPDPATKLQVAAASYGDAVEEWTTKRTTCLESRVFDDLIEQEPLVAQAVLTGSLAKATVSSARSNYLKVECLRMMSRLYNENLNKNVSELERLAFDNIVKSMDAVVEAFAACLEDSEMTKAKRAREVLKGLERIVSFVASASSDSHWSEQTFEGLRLKLLRLKDLCDSPIVKNQCDRVLAKLTGQQRIPAPSSSSGSMDDAAASIENGDEHDINSDKAGENEEASPKRKHSKKHKKRKR